MNGLIFIFQNKFILVITLFFMSSYSLAKERLYEPYECITYVVLDWENETEGYDVFDYLNEIGEYEGILLPLLVKKGYIPAGNSIDRSGKGMYLLYAENCENKTEASEYFMSFFKKRIKGFPRYIVTEAVIHPYDRPHDKGINIIDWNAILEEGKKY
ncbi:hypothetical protein [bacterium endosymbiont of Bathymodiolus sp. 5 South]|jgi:hypothetical protein|uniref:hypothetical protein n=1 Tax=bacterium endosymbiont of Bathymodiolus sp. 5 South TaxID=1181670 RepID=UPI00111A1845|nr:hypothetical protein [bacterium endosymbiont of Bathymodiolus sp. 5 South]VVH63340.1 hypothetical protein BSPWISOX_2641 [uncultured Gammaproteobacteria bacterium]VVM26175.1 hypothetical protein BSPWISOXPB_5796 [uncultured Gammaproteobacteria bacterium]